MSCAVSTIGSTSFFPAKPLGCYGDGGALFTNDDTLAEKLFAIRTHGSLVRHHYPYVGINGRFDTLQAAVILAKFPHYPGEVKARMEIGARYSELLKGCSTVPVVQKGNTHVYAQYTIRSPYRDQIGASLKAQGIPTAVYYPKCLHEQPVYANLGYKKGSFPVSESAANEVISLPMHPWLCKEDQNRVVEAVKEALLVEATS
jgi:UDP-2-acetamido-2-deoxy-ribo-hexuluronate aminotransferase